MNKWYKFTPGKGANRQKLPAERKYVLVRLNKLRKGFPNPVVVGWLKYHAGVRSEPYFVTPGCTFRQPHDYIEAWCDCLPDHFVLYDEY